MDYSSYFGTTPQALQFFGLPPTPSYSDDKIDTTVDPVDAAFFPPYDFRYSQPQPPLHQQHSQPSHTQASPLLPASVPTSDGSPPALSTIPTINSVDSGLSLDGVSGLQAGDELGQPRTRSSSEEKETLTPAQSRRKAQNRAAQRAFRERKERHVRDLEAKLSALESSATSLASDNERLKLALQQATTENELLRATSSSGPPPGVGGMTDGSGGGMQTLDGVMGASNNGGHSDTSAGAAVAAAQALLARGGPAGASGALGDDRQSSADAASNPRGADGLSSLSPATSIGSNQRNSAASPPVASPLSPYAPPPPRGSSAFLPAAATWDLIQAHPLVKRGVVDIADVCEALRGTARCDGQGPVFREEMVWRAVESARRGGGDELI